MTKIQVGVLGATGMVGQKYVSLLEDHPWFEVAYVAGSSRSACKTYEEAVAGRWKSSRMPHGVKKLKVHDVPDVGEAVQNCHLVFSALDSTVAREWEESYAELMPVISNVSTHRWTEDVPMIIPEINPTHTKLIEVQRANRGWQGFIVVKPNCSLQSYLTPIHALMEFDPQKIIVTTQQAISGAGSSLAAYDMVDNVIPHISGEEQKTETEPLKILGDYFEEKVSFYEGLNISATCTRVPVMDGHLASVSVKFGQSVEVEEILHLWQTYSGQYDLPSSPTKAIVYRTEQDRPQPRLDRNEGKGMSVVVGRLRECKVLDYKFIALSHNTIRGAAGGGILNAELLKVQGYL